MANLPSDRLYVQTESVQTRAPVSENLMQTIGASTNWALDNAYKVIDFRMNGKYANFAGTLGFDGILPLLKDIEILQLYFYSKTAGSGGVTEVDIKFAAAPGGTYNSIFSTTPKAFPGHAAYSYIGIGQTLSGFTAPVLALNFFNANGAFRFDVLQTMTGDPENIGVVIYYREI